MSLLKLLLKISLAINQFEENFFHKSRANFQIFWTRSHERFDCFAQNILQKNFAFSFFTSVHALVFDKNII